MSSPEELTIRPKAKGNITKPKGLDIGPEQPVYNHVDVEIQDELDEQVSERLDELGYTADDGWEHWK